MVLVQLTFMKQLYNSDHYYAKISKHDFEIYFRQSTWECQDYLENILLNFVNFELNQT